jgi:hypothetical protein
MSERTVIINGTAYDASTGLPVKHAPPSTPSPKATVRSSHSIHQPAQKSQTLNRRIVKNVTDPTVVRRPAPRPRPDIQKNPAVAKFAPHSPKAPQTPPVADSAPRPHPAATNTPRRAHPAGSLSPKPARTIKQEAIAKALADAPSHSAATGEVKQKRRLPRALSIASAGMALLLLGGYFTYLNMPSLSTRVAAAQAGINATYPSYHPDGYSLKGAVAYSQNRVNMKFASNSGPQSFTVDQTKSNWDSSAVLENYVAKKVGDNYLAYNEHGLTIYTFGGNAAWVNGGILYTISGDAPLSGDQIRRIATSM